MNDETSGRISKILATAGLLWCVGVSAWIWATPIRSSGVTIVASSSAGPTGAVSSTIRTVPFEASRSFAEISRLGPLPVVAPVLLAAWATWAAWQNRRLALSLATAALLAFCFLAGFSVGRGYVPGGGAMLWALLALVTGEPQRRAGVPARDETH